MQLFPDALLNRNAYDEKVRKIKLLQTHISWIFLTGKYAYKVKKPVNFRFADFSTLRKRRFFCYEEVRLNSRLSPELYYGVIPITREGNKIKLNGSGKIIEYAIKMREMPQSTLMNSLLKRDKIDKGIISRIAKIVADFHSTAETGNEVNKYGSINTIRFNWNENFEQTKKFINNIISKRIFYTVSNKVNMFMKSNRKLFEQRIESNKIRWCHGDLHSGNIFIADKIYIFDCVEFNKRISCCDVASEVAFFSMDLDFYNKRKFSEYFIKQYIKYAKDYDLIPLLDFYKCYRAWVRGKVFSFRLSELSSKAARIAKRYFDLAFEYSRSF
ncbi:MAG: hypothetical protein QXQ40_00770 [Candidatus Aenigmatarchaeota archaeon]